MTSNDR
ncbi:unnamed protein product, partial [Parascedosporium putredinis]